MRGGDELVTWQTLDVWPRVVAFDLDSTVWVDDIECTYGPPFTSDPKGFRDCKNNLMRIFPDCYPVMAWLHRVHQAQWELRPGSEMPWAELKAAFKDKKAIARAEQATREERKKISGRSTFTPVHTTTAADSDGEEGLPRSAAGEEDRLLEVAWASRPDLTTWAPAALKVLYFPGAEKVSFWEISKYSEIYPGDKKRHLNEIAKKSGCELHEILFFDNEYRNIRSALSLNVTAIYTPDGLNATAFVQGLLAHCHKIRQLQLPADDK